VTGRGRRPGPPARFGGVAVADGAVYTLPDGTLARASVDPSGVSPVWLAVDAPGHPGRLDVAGLFLPEDQATGDLPTYTLAADGRLLRRAHTAPRGRPTPTAWTVADLAPGDTDAWEAAVAALAGRPWTPRSRPPPAPSGAR
jgi:hypothetical protein